MRSSELIVATLPLGIGAIGEKTALTQEGAEAFLADISKWNRKPTILNTAMCIDERPYVSFANGVDDPDVLRALVTYQLPGGICLATTKALVGANAGIIRAAKSFKEAYEITSGILASYSLEDAGHEGCGASKFVQKSVEEALEPEFISGILGNIVRIGTKQEDVIGKIHDNKRMLAQADFFNSWDNATHEHHLQTNFPATYSKLLDPGNDPDLHGHNGVALYITDKGGFAKNMATEETGKQVFSYSNEMAEYLARMFAPPGDSDEKERIYLSFLDDAVNVANVLFHKGMPLITDMQPK